MPVWFIAALFATLLWAIVNLIDDNLLKNVYRSARFGAMISGLFGFIPSFYLFVTNESLSLDPLIVCPAVAAGVLTIVFYYFYFRTLDADDPSIAVAINNLSPALVSFLAFFMIGEFVGVRQYLGLGIVVVMAFMLVLTDAKKLKFSRAIVYGGIGAFVYAIVSILAKYAYSHADFKDVYVWVTFGFGIGGLCFWLLGASRKGEYKNILKKASPLVLVVLVFGEFINIAAELSQGYAISSGPVSLVRGIEGSQPLFVLAIGMLLQPFFPKNFREKIDKRLPRKIFCMLCMIVGLVLIQS